MPALLIAIGRRYGPRWLELLLIALVSVVRSVPAIVSVVFIYFALPFVGIKLSAFFSVVTAVTVVQVVYYSEVFRGALAAIHRGQFEAAYALGFRTPGVLRHAVLPQSFAVATPTFISSTIQLVQNTTIATVVALDDLLSAALNVQTTTGNPSPVFAAAIIYLIFLLPLVRLARRYERRMELAR